MPAPQYLYGDTNPVITGFSGLASAIEVGDLIAQIDNAGGGAVPPIQPASAFQWTTDLATTQTNFAAKFLGVSGQQRPAGATRIFGNSTNDAIRVNTTGVYEFDFDNLSAVSPGTFVAPAKGTGNNLQSQLLTKVATAALAIGVVVEYPANPTRIKVRLLSAVAPYSK